MGLKLWFVLETPNTQFFLMVVSSGRFQIITKNGSFTNRPLKNGCLGYQVCTITQSKPNLGFNPILYETTIG